MSQLIETRWTRRGMDRVYLYTENGADVGYVDLERRRVARVQPGFEAALEECLQRWTKDITAPAERTGLDEIDFEALKDQLHRPSMVQQQERGFRVGAKGE